MKIAHITATFPPYPGGTGAVCYHNALHLARRGHDVRVLTADHPPGEVSDHPAEFKVYRLPVRFRVGNAPFLPGLLQKYNVDIIHLHWPFIFGAEFVRWASLSQGIPFIVTYHNDLIGDGLRRYIFNTYSFLSNRLILRSARRVGVVSTDHAQNSQLNQVMQHRWDSVVEIPNGVDVQQFHPDVPDITVRKRYNLSPNTHIILFVGGLDRAHHFKGVWQLLNTFARLTHDDLRLMIVGSGDMQSQYEQHARELGVVDRTIFTGRIAHEDLPPYFAAADIVVLPSFPPESFGLVLIEANAVGKAVIASNIPGVRSVVQDGYNGLLVEPGDENALAQAFQRLLDDPALRLTLGRNGRRKVEAVYTWPAIVERLECIYEEVLAHDK